MLNKKIDMIEKYIEIRGTIKFDKNGTMTTLMCLIMFFDICN